MSNQLKYNTMNTKNIKVIGYFTEAVAICQIEDIHDGVQGFIDLENMMFISENNKSYIRLYKYGGIFKNKREDSAIYIKQENGIITLNIIYGYPISTMPDSDDEDWTELIEVQAKKTEKTLESLIINKVSQSKDLVFQNKTFVEYVYHEYADVNTINKLIKIINKTKKQRLCELGIATIQAINEYTEKELEEIRSLEESFADKFPDQNYYEITPKMDLLSTYLTDVFIDTKSILESFISEYKKEFSYEDLEYNQLVELFNNEKNPEERKKIEEILIKKLS